MPSKKDVPNTLVRVVQRKSGLALIEWYDGGKLQRSWVKEEMIEVDGDISAVENPSAGIPYGFDFSKYITLQATPAALSAELRNRGIWTVEDLLTHIPEVHGAIQSVYAMDVAALVSAVSAASKSETSASVTPGEAP